MSRTIDNKTLFGRNILNKGVGNITKDITNIKNKYDYSGTVLDGSLLIGNGTTGFFETNKLTAGANVTITNTAGNISIAAASGGSTLWQSDNSGSVIRPIAQTYNYIQIERTDNGNSGIQITNNPSGSSEQSAYIYLNSTDILQIESVNEKIRFAETDIQLLSSTNVNLLKFDADGGSGSVGEITLSNSSNHVVFNGVGISGGLILDQDDMASDSNTHLATQQSIKAYVDSSILWQTDNSGTVIRPKSETTINYIQLQRSNTGNSGLQLSNVNGGSEQSAYIYLNGTQNLNIETPNETLKFVESDINIINSANGTLIKYDNSATEITLGNTSDNIVFTGTGITGNLIKTEADMASNSGTHLASQASIKSYVDNSVLFDNYTTNTITNISNKDKSTSRYLKMERNVADTDFGLWIRRAVSGSTAKNAYLFLDNTENDLNIQIDTNTLRFYNTGIDALTIYNHQTSDDREMIKYKKSTSQMTINNSSDSLVLDGSGISGGLVLDEDNMASNSATHLATQQSIKAYVDSQSGGSSKFETGDSIYLQNIDKTTYNYIRMIRNDTGNSGFSMKNSSGSAFIYMDGAEFLIEPPSNNTIKLFSTSGAIQLTQKSGRVLISNADTPQLTIVGNTTDNLDLKGLTITSSQNHIFNGQINQILATSQAFKVLNGIFSNDDTDPKTVRLNTSGTNSFGFGQYTTFGSDIYTFCNNDTLKLAIIGSYTSGCLFTLQAANFECMTINPNYRNYFLFGVKNEYNLSFQPNGTIHICNDTNDLNANDAKLVIESRTSSASYYPMLELVANTGTNSTRATSFIYATGSSQMVIQAPQEIYFNSGSAYTFKCNNIQDIIFQTAYGNLYGIKTANHPSHSKNPMNNIYASEIYSTAIDADGIIKSQKGFNCVESYLDIESFATTAPSATRSAMLMIGQQRSVSSADTNIYPVTKIFPAFFNTAEWYITVQDYPSAAYLNWSFGTAYCFSIRNDRTMFCYGSVSISGTLYKGSGSFKIQHPLDEENKTLIHSFVEAPRCDNIYSGKVKLNNGKATVNMDNNDWYKMTQGTFLALNKDFRIYVTNNDFDNWDLVKGKLQGNKLKIISNNPKSNITVDWLVIGTRQDSTIKESELTDNNGDLICELNEKTKKYSKVEPLNQNKDNFEFISKKMEQKNKNINAVDLAKKFKKYKNFKKKETLPIPKVDKQVINEPSVKPKKNKKQKYK